jgi:hypothetical protein
VLKHDGGYAAGVAKGEFSIVDGSGTGELKGITGDGRTMAEHEGAMTAELEYELAPA